MLIKKNTIIFSDFLDEVDNGRVVQVEIQGNNIKGTCLTVIVLQLILLMIQIL